MPSTEPGLVIVSAFGTRAVPNSMMRGPRDLLAFARAHLADEGLRAMRAPQVVLPDIGWGTACGLGWELYDLPGGPVFGHDGNTIGQSAVLRVDPGRDVFVAISSLTAATASR